MIIGLQKIIICFLAANAKIFLAFMSKFSLSNNTSKMTSESRKKLKAMFFF